MPEKIFQVCSTVLCSNAPYCRCPCDSFDLLPRGAISDLLTHINNEKTSRFSRHGANTTVVINTECGQRRQNIDDDDNHALPQIRNDEIHPTGSIDCWDGPCCGDIRDDSSRTTGDIVDATIFGGGGGDAGKTARKAIITRYSVNRTYVDRRAIRNTYIHLIVYVPAVVFFSGSLEPPRPVPRWCRCSNRHRQCLGFYQELELNPNGIVQHIMVCCGVVGCNVQTYDTGGW